MCPTSCGSTILSFLFFTYTTTLALDALPYIKNNQTSFQHQHLALTGVSLACTITLLCCGCFRRKNKDNHTTLLFIGVAVYFGMFAITAATMITTIMRRMFPSSDKQLEQDYQGYPNPENFALTLMILTCVSTCLTFLGLIVQIIHMSHASRAREANKRRKLKTFQLEGGVHRHGNSI